MLISWSQDFSGPPETSQILYPFLWFNCYIKIEGTAILFLKFSNKDINFILSAIRHTCVCVSGGKKCLFFGNFGVFCFLETPVLRFALLPYYRRYCSYLKMAGSYHRSILKINVK